MDGLTRNGLAGGRAINSLLPDVTARLDAIPLSGGNGSLIIFTTLARRQTCGLFGSFLFDDCETQLNASSQRR